MRLLILASSAVGVFIALEVSQECLMPCSFIGVFNALQFHRVFVALQFHRGV